MPYSIHLSKAIAVAKAGALGTHTGSGISNTAGTAALAAISETLRQELEALQEDLRLSPPSEVERAFLEAAAFGTYPAPEAGEVPSLREPT